MQFKVYLRSFFNLKVYFAMFESTGKRSSMEACNLMKERMLKPPFARIVSEELRVLVARQKRNDGELFIRPSPITQVKQVHEARAMGVEQCSCLE
jgi:hypothetical protein